MKKASHLRGGGNTPVHSAVSSPHDGSHANRRRHRAALRQPRRRAPPALRSRSPDVADPLCVPDDPDYRRDRGRPVIIGTVGRHNSVKVAPTRPFAHLRVRTGHRLRRARSPRRSHRHHVRHGLGQPLGVLRHGESAHAGRPVHVRRHPRPRPRRHPAARRQRGNRWTRRRCVHHGRRLRPRGRPLLRPGHGGRPHLGLHHRLRPARLSLPVHLLAGHVHAAGRRRPLGGLAIAIAARRCVDAHG